MKTSSVQSNSSVSVHDLHRRMAGSAPVELVDVRTPAEYASAHVAGSRLAPLDALDAAAYLAGREQPGQPLHLLCQSGPRAVRAIEKFRRAGFDGCVLVEGGLQAWIDAGLPVERGTRAVLPLMRQVQIVVGLVSATGAALALGVNRWFALVPLITGGGLLFAGLTGFCGLAMLLAKMPWNRRAGTAPDSCRCPLTSSVLP